MSRTWDKKAWRTHILASRQAVPRHIRVTETASLATLAQEWAAGLPGSIVCAYLPIGSEPGDSTLLTALQAAGKQVLLPIVLDGIGLDWAEYGDSTSLTPARFGLLEPTGTRLGVTALARATGILVPALAVDQLGTRLGRGAGYYDRALQLARSETPRVAVVRGSEVVDQLPREPHDKPVTAALTPHGLITLAKNT